MQFDLSGAPMLSGTGGTVVLPQPEPEVADAKRWPRKGSQTWVARYRQTLELLEQMVAANPSTSERVILAQAELSEAIRQDIKGQDFG